jgi:hypothetical protein
MILQLQTSRGRLRRRSSHVWHIRTLGSHLWRIHTLSSVVGTVGYVVSVHLSNISHLHHIPYNHIEVHTGNTVLCKTYQVFATLKEMILYLGKYEVYLLKNYMYR